MSLDIGKRVRRSKEFGDLIKSLVFEPEAAFKTIADLLVFSAAFAYHRSLQRVSFDDTDEQIALSVFVNSQYDGFLLMLAAQASGDYNIATPSRTDDVVLIFEEYAAAGLAELREVLKARRPPVDILRDAALGAFAKAEPKSDPDFARLLSELA